MWHIRNLVDFLSVVVMVCYDVREALMKFFIIVLDCFDTFAHCDQTSIYIYIHNIYLYKHCTVLSKKCFFVQDIVPNLLVLRRFE